MFKFLHVTHLVRCYHPHSYRKIYFCCTSWKMVSIPPSFTRLYPLGPNGARKFVIQQLSSTQKSDRNTRNIGECLPHCGKTTRNARAHSSPATPGHLHSSILPMSHLLSSVAGTVTSSFSTAYPRRCSNRSHDKSTGLNILTASGLATHVSFRGNRGVHNIHDAL